MATRFVTKKCAGSGCAVMHVFDETDGPDDPPVSQAGLLEYLGQICEIRAQLADDEAFVIEHLRSTETPWQQMAKRLGVHKATLMRRYENVA